jgi:hypothetical protein
MLEVPKKKLPEFVDTYRPLWTKQYSEFFLLFVVFSLISPFIQSARIGQP